MTTQSLTGTVRKMESVWQDSDHTVQYTLPIGEQSLPVNSLIGSHVQLTYTGSIFCTHCQRKTKKSFGQGFCWPCFRGLARCDSCIISPEKCHYHLGTCREPDWGETFCMSDHIVYLANSPEVKVGITRATQLPTRWIDQGAVQALPIYRVGSRRLSGLVEDLLRQQFNDRTNWRAMLRGDPADTDLLATRRELHLRFHDQITTLQNEHGIQSVQPVSEGEVLHIRYPVHSSPERIVSFNLDKTATAAGVLTGIRGQYLIFDTGVINIRKYTAYELTVQIDQQAL